MLGQMTVPDGQPVFRLAIGRRVHISGWPAILLAPLVIPTILFIRALQKLSLLKSTTDLTSQEVASYIANFVEGRGAPWDWDDFTSIPITDCHLDAVRVEALHVPLPLDEVGEARLKELLDEVRRER